jgi:hypothetical protein
MAKPPKGMRSMRGSPTPRRAPPMPMARSGPGGLPMAGVPPMGPGAAGALPQGPSMAPAGGVPGTMGGSMPTFRRGGKVKSKKKGKR